MDFLDIMNLYDNEKQEEFSKNLNSNLNFEINDNIIENDLEWLDIIEDTVKYIDNILRNPNRFIINEEEVIKIELARRVTVESIKHLSRNTNFIQEYDKETGNVKPSKILNINKEETYDTYENRFIYTLIQNTKNFINMRKKTLEGLGTSNKTRKLNYVSQTTINDELVKINTSFSTETKKSKNNQEEILERIALVERKITDLTFNEVYKSIEKKHISLVTSPIKKTNLIMKNVNFQYATKLWDYLQQHYVDTTKKRNDVKNLNEDIKTKKYYDELFMLGYLAAEAADSNDDEKKEDVSEKIINSMVKQAVELNDNLTLENIKDMIDKQYQSVKYKNISLKKQIEDKFKNSIDKYLNKIKDFKI